MIILYDAVLLLTLLIGAVIGVVVTIARFEQTALRHWAYEKEIAEGREIYAALAMFRRTEPGRSHDER